MRNTSKMTNKDNIVAPSLSEVYKKRKEVFKNSEVFEIEHSPERLINRDEAKIIFNYAVAFIKSRISQNIFISGGFGSGKTVYAKYLRDETNKLIKKENLNVIIEYVNCRFFKDLWELPDILIPNKNKKKDQDPMDLLIDNLDKDVILILDEIDQSINPSDFFYLLSRFQEIQEKNKHKIMLILISNKNEWDKRLDGATRSSLSLRKLNFERYNERQIKEILKQRIEDGLINPEELKDNIFNTIIKKTFYNNSDLRVGLRALKMVLMKLEDKTIKLNESSASEIYEFALKEIQTERVADLDDQKYILLYAIKKSNNLLSKDLFEIYENLSKRMKIKTWKYARFVHYTNELRNQGFIEIIKVKKDKAIANKLKLTTREDVIEEEFENRKIKFMAKFKSYNRQNLEGDLSKPIEE